MQDNIERVSAGFVPWHIGNGRGRTLMLPVMVAQDLVEEEKKRSEEANAQPADDAQIKAQNARAAIASDSPASADYPESPPQGFHRVLPKFYEFTNEVEEETEQSVVVDKEIVKHRASLRSRLRKRGPDRRVALPWNGAEALDELESIQPNFHGPIRLLRNVLRMADAVGKPVRIPPILLVGTPGVGKTFFTHGLAEVLGAPHAAISFDQPTAGNQLRGSDKHWGNTESGLLFNLLCLGDFANPIVLLDEIDKASVLGRWRSGDALSQLHAALEPQTSSRIVDISTEIEFDASMVTYIATANSLDGINAPILSRFEVFYIHPPTASQSLGIAQRMAQQTLARWNLTDLKIDGKACAVLAALTPRMIQRNLDKVIAEALAAGRTAIDEDAIWRELGMNGGADTLH